jgi:D-alanine-D-alanine ligase
MDKAFAKCIISEAGGIKQAKALIATRREYSSNGAHIICKAGELGYPLFVKPARAGSSVGVTKVKKEEDLSAALEKAFAEDSKILIEEFIDGREIEVAVMETDGTVIASEPGEIDPGYEFYDYETKYQTETASYYIPARLDADVASKVKESAIRIFEALDCRTLSRVDFFVRDSGEIVFNEINTIPGFTPISMYPKLFINSGMTYGEVITALVLSALKK